MDVLSYLINLNWQSIVGMFAICWYFTYDLKIALKKLDEDMKEQGKRIDAQGKRTDQLYQMFVDLLKDRSNKQ
jgi:hypothetical protein